MTGHDALVTALHKRFLDSDDGGVACVVSGSPGSGKTFLAERFLRELPRDTVRLKGKGLRTGVAPLLPICEAIRTCADGADLDKFAVAAEEYLQAVPYVRDVLGPLVRARSKTLNVRSKLRDAIPSETYTYVVLAKLIESMGGIDVPVLFLDDVQWVDPSSIGFLGYVASQLRERRMFLLLVRRLNGNDDEHIRALLETLRRESAGRSVEYSVTGMTREEQFQALETLLGRIEFDSTDLDWFDASSQGKPYYLRELVALLRDGGRLASVAGAWRVVQRPTSPVVPPSLHAYVRERLRRTTEGNSLALDVIQYAACIGTVFDARVVADALHESARKIGSIVESIHTTSGLVTRHGGSTIFSFDHDITRDAILADLGDFASEIHKRLADVIMARPDTEPAVIAYQFAAAGASVEAANWYLKAAEVATTDSLFDTALRYGQLARKLIATTDALAQTEVSSRASFTVGSAFIGSERYGEAVNLLSSCVDGLPANEAPALRHLLGRAAARLPDHASHERAVVELRAALDGLQSGRDDAARAAIWSDLVYAYDSLGDYSASQGAYRCAVRDAKRAGDHAAYIRLLRLTCIFWQPEKVAEAIYKALASAKRHHLRYEEALCENNLGNAYWAMRDFDRASSHFSRAFDGLKRLGGYRCDTPLNNLGLVHLATCNFEQAKSFLDAAKLASHDAHSQLFIRSNRAVLDALTGNMIGAISQLEMAVEDADKTGDLFYRDCLRHNLARALLSVGRASEAFQIASACVPHHSGGDDLLVRAKRAHLLGEALVVQGKDVPTELMGETEVLDRTTKPQAWLYKERWYYCDIEFWED